MFPSIWARISRLLLVEKNILQKPEVFTDATPEGQKKIAEIIGSNLNEPVFSTQYEIVVEETIINSVNYTQFNSKRQGKKYGQAQKSCSNFVFPFENVC
jgi:hypothetical protein